MHELIRVSRLFPFFLVFMLLGSTLPIGSSHPGVTEAPAPADLPGGPLSLGTRYALEMTNLGPDVTYPLNLTLNTTRDVVRNDGAVVAAYSLEIEDPRRDAMSRDIGKETRENPFFSNLHLYPRTDFWFQQDGPRFLYYRPDGPRESPGPSEPVVRAQAYPSYWSPAFLPQIEPAAFVWLAPYHLGFQNVHMTRDGETIEQTVRVEDGATNVTMTMAGAKLALTSWVTYNAAGPTAGYLDYTFDPEATTGNAVWHRWRFIEDRTLGEGPILDTLGRDEVSLQHLTANRTFGTAKPLPLVEIPRPGGFPPESERSLDAAIAAALRHPRVLEFQATEGPLSVFDARWWAPGLPVMFLLTPEPHEVPPVDGTWILKLAPTRLASPGFVGVREVWVDRLAGERVEDAFVAAQVFPTAKYGADRAIPDRPPAVAVEEIRERLGGAPGFDRPLESVWWRPTWSHLSTNVLPGHGDMWGLANGCDFFNGAPASAVAVDAATGLIRYGMFEEVYETGSCGLGTIPPIPGTPF